VLATCWAIDIKELHQQLDELVTQLADAESSFGLALDEPAFGAKQGAIRTLDDATVTDDDTNLDVADVPFACNGLLRSTGPSTPAAAKLWPSPRALTEAPGVRRTIALSPAFAFAIQRDVHGNVSAVLESALNGSCALLTSADAADVRVGGLQVVVKRSAAFPPQHAEMREGYTLTVQTPVSWLVADSQYGALRGIQTFTQLFDDSGGALVEASLPLTVVDSPYFAWRGLHLDVARHFFSLGIIRKMVDAMSMQKFNVLHLHLVDTQSFPLVLESHPELADKGAWAEGQVYTAEGLRALVLHAARLGVRVVPEIDIPGHAAGFGMSHPEVVSYCRRKIRSNAQPTVELTEDLLAQGYGRDVKLGNFQMVGLKLVDPRAFELVADVLQELASIFPDRFVHIGADEVDFDCLAEDEAQNRQLEALGITVRQAFAAFVRRSVLLLRGLGRTAVLWEDSQEVNLGLPEEDRAVVQTWKGSAGACCGRAYVERALGAGLGAGLDAGLNAAQGPASRTRGVGGQESESAPSKAARPRPAGVIQSSELYLDTNVRDQWALLWAGTHSREGNGVYWGGGVRNLGVEACVWTERIDAENLGCRVWPRGSVVAELAWLGLPASWAQRKAAGCTPGSETGACTDGRMEALLARLTRLGVKPQAESSAELSPLEKWDREMRGGVGAGESDLGFNNWQCPLKPRVARSQMPLDFLERKWGVMYDEAVVQAGARYYRQ
jgi:hexosaminidase